MYRTHPNYRPISEKNSGTIVNPVQPNSSNSGIWGAICRLQALFSRVGLAELTDWWVGVGGDDNMVSSTMTGRANRLIES